MRNKIEIKVYLPYMMVGELEPKKRQGKRSQFIEGAIRRRLDAEDAFIVQDLPTRRVLAMAMARFPDNDVFRTMCMKLMEECE